MKYTLYFCWAIAMAGCALSLYYGEILMFEPCRLCWYQRAALFPLALILGIAAYTSDARAVRYALPICALGAGAALYQAIGTHLPHLKICEGDCIKPLFSLFGFVTFPDLSAVAFASMGIWLFVFSRRKKRASSSKSSPSKNHSKSD